MRVVNLSKIIKANQCFYREWVYDNGSVDQDFWAVVDWKEQNHISFQRH